ncbi:type VI secretion system-associated protein TagO [Pontivivens nitratireducens]|uniref:Type VI secretion system protein VasI n=1 Tax=Pontivivens nitratireducens TaxID=2758038 RepID=A0A6G7VLT0_9RHOB|nr:type VI secretion system-associated protein TagO [Pontibrevibacter nitratireducens]QIK40826.1 hypothetical protein G8E03_08655 [Pontibrevibacter nitratireducens]
MIRAAAVLFLCASGAAAQQVAPLELAIGRCAGINSRLDRLDCFDAIAPDFGIATTQAGTWALDIRPDTSDGPAVVALTLQALTGTSGFGEPVELIARCRANTTEVFIRWHEYLGADGSDGTDPVKIVSLSLDDDPVEQDRWPVSDDVEGTFTPEWGGTLLRRLAGADRLTARVTPYDEREIVATFDVRGLSQALEPLTTACNWQL